MAENEDIQVVIDPAPGEETTPGSTDTKIVAPEEGIEALKRNLETERQGRVAAERRAAESDRQVTEARTETHDSNLSLVKNAIELVKTNQDTLKGRLKEALTTQDYDAAADIQSEMSTGAAKLIQLEGGLRDIEAAPKVDPRRQPNLDVAEDMASRAEQGGWKRSADWIRRNPQFARNSDLRAKMVNAHNFVVSDGVTPDTDEYFSRVEGMLNLRPQGATEDAISDAGKTTQQRSSPSAAPVRGGGGGIDAPRGGQARLTPAEIEMAAMTGQTPEDYAKNKDALRKEGRLH